jgi:hypothetical protein
MTMEQTNEAVRNEIQGKEGKKKDKVIKRKKQTD